MLLTGNAADAASAAHGGESPVPNDYYIQNDNPRLREVVIADQATVIGSQHLTGSPGPNPSSLKALLTFVHNGGPQVAAHPVPPHLRRQRPRHPSPRAVPALRHRTSSHQPAT